MEAELDAQMRTMQNFIAEKVLFVRTVCWDCVSPSALRLRLNMGNCCRNEQDYKQHGLKFRAEHPAEGEGQHL